MNLKDFSLLKEDDHHYLVGHPQGKSIQIPKKGLSDSAHQLISKLKREQNLAEGTENAPIGGGPEIEPEMPTTSIPDSSENVEPQVTADQEKSQENLQTPESESTIPVQTGTMPQTGVASPNMEAGLQEAKSSLQAGVKAQSKAGQEETKAQKELIESLPTPTTPLKTQDQIFQDYQSKQNALQDQIQKGTIDPDRYIHNMSTGSKIASSIALLLGGFTSGFSGKENPAIENLNRAILNDIESQKNDQSKSMNLWKMNREVLGDESQANLATQNQLLTIAKAKMMKAQSQALGPIAQQNSANAILNLDNQIAQNNWMRSRLSNSGAPGTEQQHIAEMQVMEQLNPNLHKQMESKYIPGVGISRVPVSPQNRETVKAYDEMEKALNDAKAFQNTQAGVWSALPGTDLNAVAKSKANAISLAQNKLNGLNRLNEVEYKAFSEAINGLGGIRTDRANHQIDELLNQVKRKKMGEFSQLGITPFRQAASDQQAIAWAKANPNDARAAQILQMNGQGSSLAQRK